MYFQALTDVIIKPKDKMSNNYNVDKDGFFGQFGGAYVSEILHKCVTDLQEDYLPIIERKEFQDEYN